LLPIFPMAFLNALVEAAPFSPVYQPYPE